MKDNNRTLGFVHHNYPMGGAEVVTTHIAKYFANKGYRIYIFTKKLNREKIECHNDNITYFEQCDTDFIINKIKKHDINYLFSKDLCDEIKSIKSQTTCKVIFTLHSVPLWEYQYKLTTGVNNAKKSFGKMLEWYLIRLPKYKLSQKYYRRIINRYKSIYNDVDAYAVLCDKYGENVAKIVGVDYLQSKIFTLINPVIEPTEKINLQKKKQIGFIGRLTYADKRVDKLLDIWKLIHSNFPQWELLIIGEGDEEKKLKAYAKHLKLKNYKFCGYTNKVDKYLQEISILALTSSIEGWGLVLAEAQSYGVVPIAFDCSDGVNEILSPNGVNGVIVTPFNIEEYAEKLSELMSNETLRRGIQSNIITKSKEYSIDKIGLQWENLLEQLTKN